MKLEAQGSSCLPTCHSFIHEVLLNTTVCPTLCYTQRGTRRVGNGLLPSSSSLLYSYESEIRKAYMTYPKIQDSKTILAFRFLIEYVFHGNFNSRQSLNKWLVVSRMLGVLKKKRKRKAFFPLSHYQIKISKTMVLERLGSGRGLVTHM